MTQEEANQYWSTRESKTWVVSLSAGKIKFKPGVENGRPTFVRVNPRFDMYVRARTVAGARQTALDNLATGERVSIEGVRLARPYDLGCVEVAA